MAVSKLRHVINTIGFGAIVSSHGLKLVAGTADKPEKASLKEKLAAYKAQVAGAENTGTDITKGKEAVI